MIGKSGRNDYSHRHQWFTDKISQASEVFCIQVCAYSIVPQQYNLILKVDKEQALSLSDEEVVTRWLNLFAGDKLILRWLNKEKLKAKETVTVTETIKLWRSRLYEIGWYLRFLNEYIARQANIEDKAQGRFWNGRFKSTALLDSGALLAAMLHVDLKPEIEDSDGVTSLLARSKKHAISKRMVPFSGYGDDPSQLNFVLNDYKALAKWCMADKDTPTRGIKAILTRFDLNQQNWKTVVKEFEQQFPTAAGSEENMQKMARFSHRVRCRKGMSLYQGAS